jgi:hypothetical protein
MADAVAMTAARVDVAEGMSTPILRSEEAVATAVDRRAAVGVAWLRREEVSEGSRPGGGSISSCSIYRSSSVFVDE